MNTYKIIALINQIKKARLLTVNGSTVIPIINSERMGVKASEFYNEPTSVLLNINWIDERGDERKIFLIAPTSEIIKFIYMILMRNILQLHYIIKHRVTLFIIGNELN